MVQISLKDQVLAPANSLLGSTQLIRKKRKEEYYMQEFEEKFFDYSCMEITDIITDISSNADISFYDKCLLKFLRKRQEELIAEGEHYYAD